MKKYFVLACCVVLMFACSKKIVSTTTTQTTTTNTTVTADAASIEKGKQLVATNCVKCHKEPIPSDHSVAKWDNVLPKMFLKAHIDDVAQQQLIRDYVYSNLK